MPEANLSTTLGKALSIDFIEQFGGQLKSLIELLGVERLLPLAEGSTVKTYKSTVTLDNTPIQPGDIIPLSQVKVEPDKTYELVWDKKRKAVAMEDVQKYGFVPAINRTDEKLIREIQKGIKAKLFAQLATGTGTATGETLQKVLAQNWAGVSTAFEDDDVSLVSFANPVDVATYLGDANITTQNAFGMTYLQDFINNRVIFISGSIPEGTVYSTASGNLVCAYANIARGEIDKAFDFSTDETGLIGVTHEQNKERLTYETVTASGIVLFAERLDGVVVGTIAPAP